MKTAGITESQLTYMEQNAKHVTYVDLHRDQHLATNFEVVSIKVFEGHGICVHNSTCERVIIPEYSSRSGMS
jgi:hypothetical protein